MAKPLPGLGDTMAAKEVDRQHNDEVPRHPDGVLDRPGEAAGARVSS
jgi:hypothetical protein